MDSVPRVGRVVDRLVQIPGAMPSLGAAPPGCPFSPRCPEVFSRCREARPEPVPVGGTTAACWLYGEPVARL
jgi:peptide/nickel transport system ATP-binding protein